MLKLHRGDRGPGVAGLQHLINQVLETELLAVDGIFGPLTEEAVKRVQQKLGLPATGRFDHRAWQAIEESTCYRIVNVADIYDPARDEVMPEYLMNPSLIRLGGMSGGI